MKRECGIGELIPIKFDVVSVTGRSDDEVETEHATLEAAQAEYDQRKTLIMAVPCSNIRLYARDKQGYCNCVLSWFLSVNGKVNEDNRLHEL